MKERNREIYNMRYITITMVLLLSSCVDKNVKTLHNEELSNDLNITVKVPKIIPSNVVVYDNLNTRIVMFSDDSSKMSFISGTRVQICESINVSNCTYKDVFENKDKASYSEIYERIAKISSAGSNLIDARVNDKGITFTSKIDKTFTEISYVELTPAIELTYRLDIHKYSEEELANETRVNRFDDMLSEKLKLFLIGELSVESLINELQKKNFNARAKEK